MTTADDRPIRVFLSHAAADREAARLARRELSRRGAHVFTVDMLSAGGAWEAKLRDEIADSDVFVVVLTPDALESAFVLQEIGAAWALGKRVAVVAPDPRLALPLDISADVVVSDLADLGPLLQRSGRGHAAGESEVA